MIWPFLISRRVGIFLTALLLILLMPFLLASYQIVLANNIGIFALTTLGLILLTGIGGMTSFGQMAFVGIAAYATAYLALGLELPSFLAWASGSPWAGLLFALILVLIFAALLGAITLNLSGHYLPLGTIAWGVALFHLFSNLSFLGGHTGLTGIEPLHLLGLSFDDPELLFYLIWLILLLAIIMTGNLLDSRIGRAIRALRGGQAMAESMGVNIFAAKMTAFLVAAGFAAFSGWLYAYTQRFVAPAPFSLQTGIDFMFMALIGGAGQVWGAVIGATTVIALKQWLQDVLPFLLGRTGNFESVVFGLLIVWVMARTPGGIGGWLGARFGWSQMASFHLPKENRHTCLSRRPVPKAGEVILQVDRLTKQYGGLTANRSLSFSVKAGEVLAVIGPNGAGKTTLFNQLSCVEPPSGGSIHFRAKLLNGMSASAAARMGLSRTFQHVKLLPEMSILENAALGAHLRGKQGLFSSFLRLDRAEEALLLAEAQRQLVRVGLGSSFLSAAGSLALGQQRLLEIARALCSDPCLLLLDEPAAGLRHLEKQALAELLLHLKSEGMAILLVEHDMEFVMGLADRVFVMDFGSCIAEGDPQEIQKHPAVLEAYLGDIE